MKTLRAADYFWFLAPLYFFFEWGVEGLLLYPVIGDWVFELSVGYLMQLVVAVTVFCALFRRIFSVIFLGVLILEIFHLAALRIAGRFRRSGLGNLQLDTLGKAYCDVGVGFRPFPLIAAGCHKYRAVCVYLSHSAMTYGEYNHPAPPGRVSRLGLPLKQFSLVPRSQCCVLPLSRG